MFCFSCFSSEFFLLQARKEEGVLVRTLIEKRGVLVKRLHNEDDLRSAVQMWNEKNENLGEFSIVLQKNYYFWIIIMR